MKFRHKFITLMISYKKTSDGRVSIACLVLVLFPDEHNLHGTGATSCIVKINEIHKAEFS